MQNIVCNALYVYTCIPFLYAHVLNVLCMCVAVGLSSTYLSAEYMGRRFNQQPIAIFDVPEPSDTRKALVELYKYM